MKETVVSVKLNVSNLICHYQQSKDDFILLLFFKWKSEIFRQRTDAICKWQSLFWEMIGYSEGMPLSHKPITNPHNDDVTCTFVFLIVNVIYLFTVCTHKYWRSITFLILIYSSSWHAKWFKYCKEYMKCYESIEDL